MGKRPNAGISGWHIDKKMGHDPRSTLSVSDKCTQPLTLAPLLPTGQKFSLALESLIYHSHGDPNDNASCPSLAMNRGPPLLPPVLPAPLPLHTPAHKETRCHSPGMSKQEKWPNG
jgi:hypothetical protein